MSFFKPNGDSEAPFAARDPLVMVLFEPYQLDRSPFLESESWAGGSGSRPTAGTYRFSCTNATGYHLHRTTDTAGAGTPGFRLGEGYDVSAEWEVTVGPDLSTAADEYVVLLGFFTPTAWAGIGVGTAIGAGFLYDARGRWNADTVHQWKTFTRDGVGPTVTTVGDTFAAGDSFTLRVEAAADGSSVRFYVDGTLVATHAANIPTGTNLYGGIHLYRVASAAGAARTFDAHSQLFEIA